MAAPILPPPDEKLLAKALVVAEASQWTTEGSQSIGLPYFSFGLNLNLTMRHIALRCAALRCE